MHIHSMDRWKHPHEFELHDRSAESKVLWVVGLTVITMALEIITGMLFGSMALLADGWHMGTHAAALGITAVAYYFARTYARDQRFTFGTGKIGVLGGFSSAVILAVVAFLMALESVQRLFNPQSIRFNEALMVAAIGLGVNLASALLLQAHHHHGQKDDANHDHEHAHHHHHHDHNMRSAYLHVLADAVTSVLAIVALTAGKIWNWIWLDALMGIVGAVIISKWAWGLLRDTAKILLDRDFDMHVVEHIYRLIESDADNRIADLHLWKIGANQLAGIISLVTHFPQPPDHYKQLLATLHDLVHVTVEVIQCDTEPCIPIARRS
ncbi:MAG: CDF family Co(II)/Ni(II) efflux transporter DmeF [Desulfatitalea sp.]|nr:CDF family Co(II)/Ni(II) efflux transporter DmeF [Desulfatitalea sp.]